MKGQQTLLMSKLCRIDQSRIDMDGPQGRITAEDLIAPRAFGQAVENHGNGNTGTCGTQLAATNRGITDQMFAPIDHGAILCCRCKRYPYRNTRVAVEQIGRPSHDDFRLGRQSPHTPSCGNSHSHHRAPSSNATPRCYSKARALTRIATPENEVDLLNIGLHGTAQHVEKFVRLHRRAKRAEETEQADAQHENRGLTFWHEDDGTVVLHGRFPPEMGARILSALDAAMAAHAAEQPAAGWDNEGLAPEDVPRGTSGSEVSSVDAATEAGARESVTANRKEDARVFLTDVPRGTFMRGPSRTVRRADALAWMAERLFESGDTPAFAPDRHEIVVHVEAEVLADGRAGRCEIEHRTAIAAETARRLCCDAGIVPVVDGPNGEPLSVGRRTRSIPPAVRRALSSRDRGCRFPGCTATHRLHGHHVKHWANGGETSLNNLILLCPTHHRLVHEGGFSVQRLDDGAFRFTNPHGLAIRPPRRQATSSPDTIIVQNESLGLAIDCETATAHWHGERIDYDHALMVTMASWDSGDTAPEAGPAAGDWNPS